MRIWNVTSTTTSSETSTIFVVVLYVSRYDICPDLCLSGACEGRNPHLRMDCWHWVIIFCTFVRQWEWRWRWLTAGRFLVDTEDRSPETVTPTRSRLSLQELQLVLRMCGAADEYKRFQFHICASCARSWELATAPTGSVSTVCYTHDREMKVRVFTQVDVTSC